jgi:hypothetical protein
MADLKISQLTSATTPLAGTEVLPIVQGGATKQVSVANLTAGRAVSATQMTLTTGNLIVASGQGIDFSATPGTGTSELLADYEEGTCSLAISDGTTSSATTTCKYTRIGRQITVLIDLYNVNVSALSTSALIQITGMPFSSGAITSSPIYSPYALFIGLNGYIIGTTISIYKIGNSVDGTNFKLSDMLSPTNITLNGPFSYFA